MKTAGQRLAGVSAEEIVTKGVVSVAEDAALTELAVCAGADAHSYTCAGTTRLHLSQATALPWPFPRAELAEWLG